MPSLVSQFTPQPNVIAENGKQSQRGDDAKAILAKEVPEGPPDEGKQNRRKNKKERVFHANAA
jgi:hypothetical protein